MNPDPGPGTFCLGLACFFNHPPTQFIMSGLPLALFFSLFLLTPPASALPVQEDPAAGEAAPVEGTTVPEEEEEAKEMDTEVLRAKVRPMRLEAAQAEMAGWLELLEAKSLEVSEAEQAALVAQAAGDTEGIEALNAESVELRAERGRILDRTQIVIDAVLEKGGDVTVEAAYLDSVVVTPPITGMRAAYTTALAWLRNPDGGLALGLQLASALGVLIASWIVSRMAGSLVTRAMKKVSNVSILLKNFAVLATRRLIMFLGFLAALSQIGVSMGPMIAAIGAAGLVVGLALQGTLSNFASGILIMVYRPFDVGDVIASAGPTGKVEGMTLVTTTIKTFDNQTVHVPNNTIWGGVITNVTANPTRRIDMTFGIGYDDDIERAREVLLEVVNGNERVLADPEPTVRLHELADSSVNFVVRPWSKTEDYWDVFWDVTRDVKKRFDEEGISIPFPQRDVHLIPAGPGGAPEASAEPQREVPRSTTTAESGKDAAPAGEDQGAEQSA